MRFLCLHGIGTNSKVFEMQTGVSCPSCCLQIIDRGLCANCDPAALRYALGNNHVYDFVEGVIPYPAAPELGSLFPSENEYFSYFDETSPESCRQAIDDLETYIASEGPFDAVMAFSQGACLAATLMIRQSQQDSKGQTDPPFKCAIFFSGGGPADPILLKQGKIRMLDYATDGELIHVPTAHIWGANDQQRPIFSSVLSKLSNAAFRIIHIHTGGHEIPGPKDPIALDNTVKAIQRTIDIVLSAQ